jgi:site-specific DNA-methyltransferase (adenine-specific)
VKTACLAKVENLEFRGRNTTFHGIFLRIVAYMDYQLYNDDCLNALKSMPENSVDSVVTDPPYGLSFMGRKWDYDVPGVEIWAECLRVLKPGGYLLAFAGTRTQHHMAVKIEDAGFEIRDVIAWVYGSGFPKSLDVSKAIDKAAGAERGKVRVKPRPETSGTMAGASDTRPWIEKSRALGYHEVDGKEPVTKAAHQWQGWGTALKPALEPVTVARKPLIGTVAANVLEYGTGAINIDGCRIPRDPDDVSGWSASGSNESENRSMSGKNYNRAPKPDADGRWPANFIHDNSDAVTALLGDASRFFYCAKASKRDRDEGLEGFEVKRTGGMEATADGRMLTGSGNERTTARANVHPTVKPTDLMRYLCRLVTQPGGIVLDPFMGSGSTGKAAILEGFRFIGIEREPEYFRLAEARIKHAAEKTSCP